MPTDAATAGAGCCPPAAAMNSITGSANWDLFVVYIIFCTLFILFCCVSVIFMFWCCPARDPSGAALAAGARFRGNTSVILQGSPTATRIGLRRMSSVRQLMELEAEQRRNNNNTAAVAV